MTAVLPITTAKTLAPKRFRDVRFDGYKPENDSEAYALKTMRRWVEVVQQGKFPMVALIGPQGTGKSHLLYAASWALLEAGVAHGTFPWYRLADELRYGGKNPYNGQAYEAHQMRAFVWERPIILLDEVRPTAGTAFDDTELAKLACHCYDNQIPVVLTTNVSPLSDVLGPAAASRFTQIVITGRDRRQEQDA